jgi:hypothetical protein
MTTALKAQRLLLCHCSYSCAAPGAAPAPIPTQIVRKLHRYLLALWNLWAIASISLSTRLPCTTLSNGECREWDLELRS